MQKVQKFFRLDLKRPSCNYFEEMDFRLTVSQVCWVSNQKTGGLVFLELIHVSRLGPKS